MLRIVTYTNIYRSTRLQSIDVSYITTERRSRSICRQLWILRYAIFRHVTLWPGETHRLGIISAGIDNWVPNDLFSVKDVLGVWII